MSDFKQFGKQKLQSLSARTEVFRKLKINQLIKGTLIILNFLCTTETLKNELSQFQWRPYLSFFQGSSSQVVVVVILNDITFLFENGNDLEMNPS